MSEKHKENKNQLNVRIFCNLILWYIIILNITLLNACVSIKLKTKLFKNVNKIIFTTQRNEIVYYYNYKDIHTLFILD